LIFPKRSTRRAIKSVSKNVQKIVQQEIGKLPSAEGAFASEIIEGDLTGQIGGMSDTNDNITRRILFLTEGLPVGSRALFDKQRKQLVDRYIENKIPDHQITFFFLNDVIRYWRTICVDFENKTFEQGKDWGVRNIKLVFSRKLLYFGGLLIAAETAYRTPSEKRDIAIELMDLAPLDRLSKVCKSAGDRAIAEYNNFLDKISDSAVRKDLSKVKRNSHADNEQFRSLKNRGHHFSFHLISALKSTYSDSHPIHRAVIM
jgi:hypothetical protein